MSPAPDRLFVYGTLMCGFPRDRLIADTCQYAGSGTVSARLLDLGRYPGAVPDTSGAVRGEVYRILAPGVLAILDREEGYRPGAPHRSLYVRRAAPVRMDDGREVTAWIYWYNGTRAGAGRIPTGDYRRHLPARVSPR